MIHVFLLFLLQNFHLFVIRRLFLADKEKGCFVQVQPFLSKLGKVPLDSVLRLLVSNLEYLGSVKGIVLIGKDYHM